MALVQICAAAGGVNALRSTCREMRDTLDRMVVTSAEFVTDGKNYQYDVDGLSWLARRVPMLVALDVSAGHDMCWPAPWNTGRICDAGIIGRMQHLTSLKALHRMLPDGWTLPSSLREVNLCGCGALPRSLTTWPLPASLMDVDFAMCGLNDERDDGYNWTRPLVAMKRLCVARNLRLTNMSALADHPSLTYLDISGCDVSCLVVPRTLRVLKAEYCADLSDLTPLRAAADTLASIDVRGCHKVATLAGIGTTIETLDACIYVDDPMVAHVCAMTGLRELRGLVINDVSDFSPFAALKSLRTLVMHVGRPWEMTPVMDLSAIATLTGLHDFEIHGCNRLRNLVPLASLSAFTKLHVHAFCDGMDHVTALKNLRMLDIIDGFHRVDGWGTSPVCDLSPLTALSALTFLRICEFPSVTVLPLGLSCVLEHLDINCCPRLNDVSSLQSYTMLRSLSLDGCPLSDLTPLGALTALTNLRPLRGLDLTLPCNPV